MVVFEGNGGTVVVLKKYFDLFHMARARRIEILRGAEAAQDYLEGRSFRSAYFRAFAGVYLCKLMTINRSPIAKEFVKEQLGKREEYTQISDGYYFIQYLEYLSAVLGGDAPQANRIHREIAKQVPKGLPRGCLESFHI